MHIGLAIHILFVWLQGVQEERAANPDFALIEHPEALIQDFWIDLYNENLIWLALLWCSVVFFAGSMLFGRAIIPSLTYTGHLANRFERTRLLFYASAALGGLLVITFAALWLGNMGVITDIYDRVWY